MAHRKAGGTTRNGRDSNPKYLGIKLGDGSSVSTGMVIVRQRGTKVILGKNVGLGKDHTIFALKDGKVVFKNSRGKRFDGSSRIKKMVSVV